MNHETAQQSAHCKTTSAAFDRLRLALVILLTVFTAELMLGFHGAFLRIGGLSVRYLLFALTFAALYGGALVLILREKLPLFRGEQSVKGAFDRLDLALFILLFATAVWMLVIPALKGTDVRLAIKEAMCMLVLTLAFPLKLFFTFGKLSFAKAENLVLILTIALGAVHILLYVCASVRPTFVECVFRAVLRVFGNTGVMPAIVSGHGYLRVIFPCSVLLFLGFYFFFAHIAAPRIRDYAVLVTSFIAMLFTVTKALWLGSMAAGGFFFCLLLADAIRRKVWKHVIRFVCVVLCLLLIAVLLNATLCHGILAIRMRNTFRLSGTPSDNPDDPTTTQGKDPLEELDEQGAVISNMTRMEQVKHLLDKWKISPLIGYGYGSYVEHYLRSTTAKYSYEMTTFAMLMKLGVLGCIFWAVYGVLLAVQAFRKRGMLGGGALCALFSAFFLALNTNPYLFNFIGMGLLLFLHLSASVPSKEECP